MNKHFRVHFKLRAADDSLGATQSWDCMADDAAGANEKCTTMFVNAAVHATIERNRFRAAQAIQMGACNPIAVVNSLADAVAMCRAENMGTDEISNDPAVQLIVHQLAHLTGTQYWEQAQYQRAADALVEKIGQ
jgi:hypothetical protein